MLMVFALAAAIGFFYLTKDRNRDLAAEAVTRAAGDVDRAATAAGDAGRATAERMREPD